MVHGLRKSDFFASSFCWYKQTFLYLYLKPLVYNYPAMRAKIPETNSAKLLSYRSYESMADAHVDSSSPMDQLINESDPNSRKRGSVAASVRPPHDDQTSAKRPPVQPPKVTKCLHMIFW